MPKVRTFAAVCAGLSWLLVAAAGAQVFPDRHEVAWSSDLAPLQPESLPALERPGGARLTPTSGRGGPNTRSPQGRVMTGNAGALAGVPPSQRFGHTAIFDPARDRMVVFGGWDGASLNDVWALSLAGEPGVDERLQGWSSSGSDLRPALRSWCQRNRNQVMVPATY